LTAVDGALVLSIPGAILAPFATGTDLSMPAMIGMIMLMGIATKNSILLVEAPSSRSASTACRGWTRCGTPVTSARGPSS
jgi:multidrug efflux pump subunit AcrB